MILKLDLTKKILLVRDWARLERLLKQSSGQVSKGKTTTRPFSLPLERL